MEDSIDNAQKVLSRLAQLLRTMLEADRKHTASLEEEIKYLRDYLMIEQVRFQDRLEVIFDVPNDILNASVPYLILQPLAENAVKHGFSTLTGEGAITIHCRKEGDRLVLSISDDGSGMAHPERLPGRGVGLRNVRDRLNQLYPDDNKLEFLSPNRQGFIARMTIPFSSYRGIS